MSRPVLVEACVDSVESALAAEAGGAGRIELCDDLVEGGTTPSLGMIAVTRERVRIPIFVLVRPRGGDFLYTPHEVDVMRRDIAAAKDLGADGVVIGALRPDGTVDTATMRSLVDASRPLAVTFHRAVDVSRDLDESLEALLELGVDRVLTSGGTARAVDGIGVLRRLVARAGDRLTILAGGGITSESAARIVGEAGVPEIHVRGVVRVESAMRHRHPGIAFGKPYTPDDYVRQVTSSEAIREITEVARQGAPRAAAEPR